ncbi:MAG: FUSC family protein [Rudaea sp.]
MRARPNPTTSNNVTLISALREALVTMLAAIANLLCALTLAPGSGAAVLAVVLCLSLSRSQLDRDWRHRLESALLLPIVGMATIGVGLLLLHAPWLGATVFVAGMFVSIWLRRFGAIARRIGSLIALPFVTLLVTPPIVAPRGGPIPSLLLPVIIALLALLWVSVLHALARAVGFLPASRELRQSVSPEPVRASTLRPIASTRMAIQMAIALALSFVIGYLFFSDRWAWIVLTAFIVISGNRGRLEVAYKSVLRVAGAAAGTVLALVLSAHLGDHGVGTAALILASIFIGVWLRPLGYAWWALFVTVALALLQGFANLPASHVLLLRFEEIVIGAVVAVATAWWILPVRSTGVLRRRLADALSALGTALDPAAAERTPAAFIGAVASVEQLAPAFRASRLATNRLRKLQPADWIDALVVCSRPAIALIESGETPADVRRAVGTARQALLEPDALLPALQGLQQALAR